MAMAIRWVSHLIRSRSHRKGHFACETSSLFCAFNVRFIHFNTFSPSIFLFRIHTVHHSFKPCSSGAQRMAHYSVFQFVLSLLFIFVYFRFEFRLRFRCCHCRCYLVCVVPKSVQHKLLDLWWSYPIGIRSVHRHFTPFSSFFCSRISNEREKVWSCQQTHERRRIFSPCLDSHIELLRVLWACVVALRSWRRQWQRQR